MDPRASKLLTAPEPELEALSFALAEPTAVGEWISRLPMANVPEAAGQVRQAVFEIARLDVTAATRIALLEGIRPTVLYLTTRLDRSAIGSGASQADATARLAQRLQTNLCSGYVAVVVNASNSDGKDKKATRTASLAVHRAISDLSRTLLRTLQFYVAPADQLWLKLNQLYLLAEQMHINDEKHSDAENDTNPELSIESAYLRALLLSLARPYQLRPGQLSTVFHALGSWSPMVSLSGVDDKDLQIVDLSSDHGPGHAGHYEYGPSTRGIRSDVLVYELEALLNEKTSSLSVPNDFDPALVRHLADAWNKMKPRAFSRSLASDSMKVSVGLRATHYFLSGNTEFSEVLKNSTRGARKKNPFLQEQVRFLPNANERKDIWEDAFDVGRKIPENPNIDRPEKSLLTRTQQQTDAPQEVHRYYNATAVDTSPGGYRLKWGEPFPPTVQTGEVIGLRDISENNWCIAVVRWLRQENDGAFMGIELIAPQAVPVAIRVLKTKGGQSEFQRAFLLPTLKAVGQPPTVITPTAPFQTGQKIQLTDNGIHTTAQLGDCLLKTESFNQFTFRVLDGYLENPRNHRNMSKQDDLKKHQQTGFR